MLSRAEQQHNWRHKILSAPAADLLTAIAPAGNFAVAELKPTNFFLALTLRSLTAANDPELAPLVARLRAELVTQKSSVGSWNYWPRNSVEAKTRPLPDDLDTTSCTLLALLKSAEETPTEWIAQFAHILTLREVEPGGPYKTWIVPAQTAQPWQEDIDPVVNANIGAVLNHFAAVPEKLLEWLAQAITDRQITSPYYPGRTAFRYFLAPWYHGVASQLLDEECSAALQRAIDGGSIQDLAFALATASYRQELSTALLSSGLTRLHDLCQTPKLTLEAVCIDAIHSGVADHAASPAFSLALVYEAMTQTERRLSTAEQLLSKTNEQSTLNQTIIASARQHCQQLPAPLAAAALEAVDELLANDTLQNLTALPFTVALAATGSESLLSPSNSDIGAAHLLGWVAYTLYDDIVDGDCDPGQLWLANALARQTLQLFLDHFPNNPWWTKKCTDTFITMDVTNLQEQQNWRLVKPCIKPETVWQLPQFMPKINLAMLTGRSQGALLAPLALALRVDDKLVESQLAQQLETFLLHLIAARQLGDDAHDWEEDLTQGRLNSASRLLFAEDRAGTALDLSAELPALRNTFWQTALPKLASKVEEHCQLARQAATNFRHPQAQQLLNKLLLPPVSSMQTALRERDLTRSLLDAYKKL